VTHTHTKARVQRSVGSKDGVETDGQTDGRYTVCCTLTRTAKGIWTDDKCWVLVEASCIEATRHNVMMQCYGLARKGCVCVCVCWSFDIWQLSKGRLSVDGETCWLVGCSGLPAASVGTGY